MELCSLDRLSARRGELAIGVAVVRARSGCDRAARDESRSGSTRRDDYPQHPDDFGAGVAPAGVARNFSRHFSPQK